jgi:hypothetical protein
MTKVHWVKSAAKQGDFTGLRHSTSSGIGHDIASLELGN